MELFRSDLGAVWAARPPFRGRRQEVVLLRRIPTRCGASAKELASLGSAAQWARQLSHDSVVPVLEVLRSDAELGVVSAYAPCDTMRSLLRQASVKRLAGQKGAPIPVAVALHLTLDMLDSIAFLERHTAHRSELPDHIWGGLSPDTIVVGADGHARLLEPGLSGAAMRCRHWASHPRRAAYAAPELLSRRGLIDARADLFTVGVLLWEMLLNRPLFSGSSHEAIAQNVCHGRIPRVDAVRPGGNGVTADLADVVERALQRDPDARYPSAEAMADAIWAAGHSVAKTKRVIRAIHELTGGAITRQAERIAETIATAERRDPTEPAESLGTQHGRWRQARGLDRAGLGAANRAPRRSRDGRASSTRPSTAQGRPAHRADGSDEAQVIHTCPSWSEPGWSEVPTIPPAGEPPSSSRAPTAPPTAPPGAAPAGGGAPASVRSAVARRSRRPTASLGWLERGRRAAAHPCRAGSPPQDALAYDGPLPGDEVCAGEIPQSAGSTLPSPTESGRRQQPPLPLGLLAPKPRDGSTTYSHIAGRSGRRSNGGAARQDDEPNDQTHRELPAPAAVPRPQGAVVGKIRPRLRALAPLIAESVVESERLIAASTRHGHPGEDGLVGGDPGGVPQTPEPGPPPPRGGLDSCPELPRARVPQRLQARGPRSSGTLEPTISKLASEELYTPAAGGPPSGDALLALGRWLSRRSSKTAAAGGAGLVLAIAALVGASVLGGDRPAAATGAAGSEPAVRIGVVVAPEPASEPGCDHVDSSGSCRAGQEPVDEPMGDGADRGQRADGGAAEAPAGPPSKTAQPGSSEGRQPWSPRPLHYVPSDI